MTVTFNVNNSVEDEEAPGEYDASKKDDAQDAQVTSLLSQYDHIHHEDDAAPVISSSSSFLSPS